jgi:inward rectifier potassium channel
LSIRIGIIRDAMADEQLQAHPSPPIYGEEENRDLGFGSVIARERIRLLNRDGSFNVKRRGMYFWESLSLYHWLLTMPWWTFGLTVISFYALSNVVFAALYIWVGGPSPFRGTIDSRIGDGFLQAFFFSVQTFSTIGFGNITPAGVAANVIVSFESLAGLLSFALITGLLFARFSRPTAKIIFSKWAIVAPYRGTKAFEFRITNGRSNQLIEVEAKVIFSRFENVDGASLRRFYPLKLERDKVAFFPLSWTVVHPIDKNSPLFGTTNDQMLSSSGEFLVLLTGIDETFSQTVHSRSSYTADEVIWGVKFSNIFDPLSEDKTLAIDMARFHAIEKLT